MANQVLRKVQLFPTYAHFILNMVMDIKQARLLVEQAETWAPITMDKLSYPLNALDPVMSESCVKVHYQILTKKYFDKYKATGDLFQKAGALLHNDVYWPLMQPYHKQNPCPKSLEEQISDQHGSIKKFKDLVLEQAMGIQGNGWVFIMQDLQIQTVQNHVYKPGIACAIDMWEHATVDHDFNRESFLKGFWNIVNWQKLEQKLSS